jgi:hypothetical protein
MNDQTSLRNGPAESRWELSVYPAAPQNPASRARIIDEVRQTLVQELRSNPSLQALSFRTTFGAVSATRRSPVPAPGTALRLVFAPEAAALDTRVADQGESGYMQMALPNEAVAALGARLVGLDAIRDDLVTRLRCRSDPGFLDRWSRATGSSVADSVRTLLAERTPLFVFAGDPGVGKSALARVALDRYCRLSATPGTLLVVGTEARGNGLVGDLGKRLRSAFVALERLPASGLRALVIEEADAVAVRRSEAHAHHEDRAGTATILQCLDHLAALPNAAVIMTTNLADTLDAALRRRATLYAFERPGPVARRALLRRALPAFSLLDMARAVRLTHGMTPSDIETALLQAHLDAVRQQKRLASPQILQALRQAERTGRV